MGVSLKCRTLVVMSLLLFSWRRGSGVEGHGRLIEPPSRATMWRYGFDSKANYDDNAGYCGGKSQLWNRFGGRCGVCGDPWEPRPRAHERGGRYYDGTPVRYYEEGEVITVVMGITANHRGWVEFRLCPYDWPADDDLEYDDDGNMVEVSQSCLDKHLLELADGSGTRFYLPEPYRVGEYSVDVRLPPGLSCDKCLLQWKWNVANSWGTDPDGTSCLGCGEQEQFYACADIVIESDGWDDAPDYPETEPPPHPTPPPPSLPRTPDLEPRYPPRQTYPPVYTTEYPATFYPWNVPDEGNEDYPETFPSSRGGYPGIDEGKRVFTPVGREPGTMAPAPRATEKPKVFPPTSPTGTPARAPRPTPTKRSNTTPKRKEETTPREDGSRRVPKKPDRPAWDRVVPSFWRWLLLNHPTARTAPETPAAEGPSIPGAAGEEGVKPTPSWWQKLVAIAERTVWEPRSVSELQERPHSRSKKSSTAATTTTATPTTPTTTMAATTTTTTTAAGITASPLETRKKATANETMSKLRSIAEKLKEIALPVPWWLRKIRRTGPAFLFHSWDDPESTREESPSQSEDAPEDYPSEEINIVAYSGTLGPLDYRRRERMKVRRRTRPTSQITAAASRKDPNADVIPGAPPFSEQAMQSAASSSNEDDLSESRDILLTNEHGFETVNMGHPFEAAKEKLFISPVVGTSNFRDGVGMGMQNWPAGWQGQFDENEQQWNSVQNPMLTGGRGMSGYLPVQQNSAFYAREMVCSPAGGWVRYPQMWRWCEFHCRGGYCPPSHCICA